MIARAGKVQAFAIPENGCYLPGGRGNAHAQRAAQSTCRALVLYSSEQKSNNDEADKD